jgi:hypothetical protein
MTDRTESPITEAKNCCRLCLKCDGTRADSRFRLSAKWTSPFKSAGASGHSNTGSRGVRISGSNARDTMFRGSVKGTGYPLHSPVSPSLPLPCVTMCPHISTGLYHNVRLQQEWLHAVIDGTELSASRSGAALPWEAGSMGPTGSLNACFRSCGEQHVPILPIRSTSSQLTLSDPTSDLVRQYDFPILLRFRKTSDTVFVAFVRPLSEHVRRFSSCSTDFSQQIAQVVLFTYLHSFLF